MTADQFTAAQQAADLAYEMTLYETGSGERAADAYKAVMTAFYDADEAQSLIDTARANTDKIAATQKRGGRGGWISNTARLVDDLDRPDPQDMTHAAIIRRANMDDRFFYQLVAADDGMMGDTD